MLRNKKDSFAGRSLLLNLIFITVNIIGLCLLVMGYHPAFSSSALLYKIFGYGLIILSLIAIYLFEGWILYAYISRIIVGGVFIISGLIKANDPKGFAYKLEEYFEDGALAYRIKGWFHWDSFSLEYLIQYALIIAVVICVLEILLGALLLLGSRLKSTSWLIVLMLLFFTFLTWHTKECDPNATFTDVDTYALNSPEAISKIANAKHDKSISILSKTSHSVTIKEIKRTQCVTDCGCFGDAMKGSLGRSMTPSESFWKDILLLYLALIIFIPRRKIVLNSARENSILIFGGLLVISYLSYLFSWGFPVYFTLAMLLFALWVKRIGGKIWGNEWGLLFVLILIPCLFVSYVLLYLPVKDYRPYAVGKNLIKEMNNGRPGEYLNLMVYTNKKTQQDTTIEKFNQETKPIWSDTTTWKFKTRTTKVITPEQFPSIQQFEPGIGIDNMTPEEKNFPKIAAILDSNQIQYVQLSDTLHNDQFDLPLTEYNPKDSSYADYYVKDTITQLNTALTNINLKDYIVHQRQILLVISRQINEGNYTRISRLIIIAKKAKEQHIPMLLITASSKAEVLAFRKKMGLYLPTVKNDNIELKAMTRSNPTLMILKNGVVEGKYSSRSIPSWEWLIENRLKIKK